MARYRFTRRAVDDLSNIWNYTRVKWSENQADSYYQMLIDSCSKIASRPDVGKSYSVISEGLAGFKSGRHIIFYRKTDNNAIEIIRILHEKMDLRNRISKG